MYITVAIPTFRRPGMLRRALESALTQTRGPDLVVVGDDGNQDEVREICQEYSEHNILYCRRHSARRMTDNWDFVLRQASDGLVAMLEDDNYWLPHHLEAAELVLEQHPDANLYHCGHREASSTGGTLEFYKTVLPPWHDDLVEQGGGRVSARQVVLDALVCGSINSSTVVLRQALIDVLPPFDYRYLMGMDTLMWTRAAMIGGVVYGPSVAAVYTYHGANVSHEELKTGRATVQARAARRLLLTEAFEAGVLTGDNLLELLLAMPAPDAAAVAVLSGHRSAPLEARRTVRVLVRVRPEVRRYTRHLRWPVVSDAMLPYSDLPDRARRTLSLRRGEG